MTLHSLSNQVCIPSISMWLTHILRTRCSVLYLLISFCCESFQGSERGTACPRNDPHCLVYLHPFRAPWETVATPTYLLTTATDVTPKASHELLGRPLHITSSPLLLKSADQTINLESTMLSTDIIILHIVVVLVADGVLKVNVL